MKDFDFGEFETSGASGIDALFQREAQLVTPTVRRRVASLQDLSPFTRLSADQFIHKSERDLWTIRKEGDGKFYIERMFDDNGEPLKG
jgi:hypothetical protein